MRALALLEDGGQPQVTDLPAPAVADGEVVVRVAASSVNPHDVAVATGAAARYLSYRFPVVLGSDVCGTVEQVGAGVDDLAVGDRVFGLVRERVAARGAFADLVALDRDWVSPAPERLDDAECGVLGLAALTAWRCVEALAPTQGQVVVVNGAAGGVGSYVVQMLVAAGAAVVATARPGGQAGLVEGLGATGIVDWATGDLAAACRAAAPGTIDGIVDLATGDRAELGALAEALLGPSGRVVSTRRAADPDGSRPAHNVLATPDRAALTAIADLADQGHVRAPITRSFDFDGIPEALDAVSAGGFGKFAVRLTGR